MVEAIKSWPYLWVAISLLSNMAIIWTEYLNRQSPSFPAALRYTFFLIVLAQACLWYSYRHAPTLLIAWIVFTVGNSAVRLTMAATVLGEPFHGRWAVLAAVLMALGSYCIKRATG